MNRFDVGLEGNTALKEPSRFDTPADFKTPIQFNKDNQPNILQRAGTAIKSKAQDFLAENFITKQVANKKGIIGNIKANLTGDTPEDRAKSVQISQERQAKFQSLLQEGKSRDEAIKISKYTLTPTQIADTQNFVLGFIGGEGEVGKVKPKAIPEKIAAAEKLIPKDIELLTQEAKKYKNAEDFVSSQTKLFRGDSGGQLGAGLDLKKLASRPQGLSMTVDEKVARKFMQGKNIGTPDIFSKTARLDKFGIKPDAKILDSRTLGKEFEKVDFEGEGYIGEEDMATIQHARENGYDILDFSNDNRKLGGHEKEMIVLNPDILYTKPQLTDLYNQATKETTLVEGNIPTKESISDAGSHFVDQLNKLPSVAEDAQLKNQAAAMTQLTSKRGLKGMAQELSDQFRGWVNTRAATKIEGMAAGQKFKGLDDLGMEGVFKVQSGASEGILGDIRTYFNDKFKKLEDAGVDMNYKPNYLPQLWQNSQEEVNQFFEKRLGLKPSFTLESVFKNYEEGVKAGLTPKFNTVSELVTWYEQRANKALADHNFFNYLATNGFIVPSGDAPLGYKTLNPDHFPQFRTKFKGGEYAGTYKAAPNLADAINNYLVTPEGGMASFAKFATATKNIVLSSGVPGTGINAHGLNILVRNTLASNNPISGFLRGTAYLINPGLAEKFIQQNLDSASFAVKNGLTLSAEEHTFGNITDNLFKKGLGKLQSFQQKYFENPLFQKALPALKLKYFSTIYQELAQNLPEKEAAHEAAKIANGMFGGINYAELGRSKDFQNVLRSIILAPDWAEGQIKTGTGVVKSLVTNTPQSKIYRRFARNLVLAYASADTLNKVLSGHHMHQNDAGHTFQIEIGKTGDGKKRYLAPFGTAVDFVRIPYDIALSLKKGDISQVFKTIKNRISTALSAGIGLVYNVDYAGNPIYGKDKYGRPMPVKKQIGGVASTISQSTLPAAVSAGIDLASGRSNFEQAASQALELPFKYGYPPKKQKSKTSNRFNF